MHSSTTRTEPRRASGAVAEITFLCRALRSPTYRRFALSSLISVTGTWMQVVAQNWLVFRISGSAAPVGVTIMLQSLPSVGLGVWGGALADRFSKRTILLVTQPLLAALALGLALFSLAGTVSIPVVYAFALALGLVNAADAPAHGAFGAELVDEEALGNAVALGSIFNSAGRIIGMALGGFIVAAFGAGPAFLLNGVSYFAVVAALLTMPRAAPADSGAESQHAGGVRDVMRFVATTPRLVGALLLVVLVSALGRNYQVTMASMSSDVFGSGAAGYATLSSVFAVGALLGGVVAARCRRQDLKTMLGVAIVTGLGQMFASVMPTFVSFASCIAGLAVGAVVFDTAASTLIQQTAGTARRGRLVAVLTVVSMAGATAGAPILGWLSDDLDPRAALQIGGAVRVAGAGGGGW